MVASGWNGAAYTASTVPTEKYVRSAVAGRMKVNMLAPGCYKFVRGVHKPNTPNSRHDAFRENGARLVIRTKNDRIFDPAVDPAEVTSPWDNIHAGFGLNTFSSAGCQVVKGTRTSGEWLEFKNRGYNLTTNQSAYRYLLLPSQILKLHIADPDSPRVLIGSTGSRVRDVQRALEQQGATIATDGDFGPQTGLAILKFQRSKPHIGADAIVGADTAGALGISHW